MWKVCGVSGGIGWCVGYIVWWCIVCVGCEEVYGGVACGVLCVCGMLSFGVVYVVSGGVWWIVCVRCV